MLLVSKHFDFCASHRVFRPDWSDEKNREVYGKCANKNNHGHNYRLEVSVAGDIDPETGYILDASKLGALVEELILSQVDHYNLNMDVEWLSGMIVSSENLVNAFWSRLEPAVKAAAPNAYLYELKLWETRKIFVLKRAD